MDKETAVEAGDFERVRLVSMYEKPQYEARRDDDDYQELVPVAQSLARDWYNRAINTSFRTPDYGDGSEEPMVQCFRNEIRSVSDPVLRAYLQSGGRKPSRRVLRDILYCKPSVHC